MYTEYMNNTKYTFHTISAMNATDVAALSAAYTELAADLIAASGCTTVQAIDMIADRDRNFTRGAIKRLVAA